MIGISSNRLTEKFLEGLNLDYQIIDKFDPQNMLNVDGLFIDWVSKVSSNEVAWMKQASLLQTHIKSDMPIVIFDREMSLTKKEVDWCKKFNVHLFEPFLNSGRSYFTYLPEWLEDSEILIDDEDRVYDVVYSYHKIEWKIKEFEKWIKDYARIFPNKKVAYATMSISDFKMEEFGKDNLIFQKTHHPIYNEGNMTVALDTERQYKMGYLSPMYLWAMNLGCLPLLPIEHKYFHGMFQGLIIKDLKDMDYFVSTMSKVKDVVIEEIFDRIKKEWNEFTIEHAIDIIRSCYE
jgi:hypothetical protein